jgi:hypothetical protein
MPPGRAAAGICRKLQNRSRLFYSEAPIYGHFRPADRSPKSLMRPICDRAVQGALKLILEPIFEADFQPGSFGYRPKKSAHAAIQRVSRAILEGKTYVIDLDLRSYLDPVPYCPLVTEKVAAAHRAL